MRNPVHKVEYLGAILAKAQHSRLSTGSHPKHLLGATGTNQNDANRATRAALPENFMEMATYTLWIFAVAAAKNLELRSGQRLLNRVCHGAGQWLRS